MFISRALICCTLIVFGVCSANIPFEQVQFNIFDNNQTHLFESLVLNSLKSTGNFFANKNIANIITNIETSTLSGVIPFVGQFSSLTLALRNFLARDGDWMESFVRSIANESRNNLLALDDIH